MTTNKHLKRRARSLAASTGQPYATALRRIRSQLEDRMSVQHTPIPGTCAQCSFCSKPEPAVQRLVAGPGGVFICDECVDSSSKIIDQSGAEESARSRAEYFDPSVELALTRLGELIRSADRIEGQFASAVRRLREHGTEWTAIAAAAAMSVESIQERLERSDHPKSL
jgi:ATP-dependent Clp protease ATP-binding subunit ClpX